MKESTRENLKRGHRKGGTMSSSVLDGGNPSTWFGETGDQFDLVLQITAKPFHHGKNRAFDPAGLDSNADY